MVVSLGSDHHRRSFRLLKPPPATCRGHAARTVRCTPGTGRWIRRGHAGAVAMVEAVDILNYSNW